MNKLLQRSSLFVKKNASTILTFVGSAGVVATAALAVKATPKALKLIEEEKKARNVEKLSVSQTIETVGMTYVPAVITGVATIGCIFGANVLNKRKQAALMSAYALLDSTYKEYKNKVTELYGEDAHERIQEEIVKDKYVEEEIEAPEDNLKLFYDEYSGRYFESTTENVIKAEYEFNRKLSAFQGVYLNEFYEMLDIPPVDYGEYIGWSSAEVYDMQWYTWIDFHHKKVTMDDGLECYIISWSFDPSFGFEDY